MKSQEEWAQLGDQAQEPINILLSGVLRVQSELFRASRRLHEPGIVPQIELFQPHETLEVLGHETW